MTKYVGIIGVGFVGSVIKKSFELKGLTVKAYDKYKKCDTFEECLNSEIIFIAVPTQYNEKNKEYDKSCIYEVCSNLSNCSYKGLVVLKCTVEPNTTNILIKNNPKLKIIHNPEFLSVSTAFEDFHYQNHIVLGKGININEDEIKLLSDFYKKHYTQAEISICSSTESECMKIFCNSFYSVKVQLFNELYLLCQNDKCNYSKVLDLMLKNGWINPMHTQVPGPDGKLSYGGLCFPKDTNALLSYMKKSNCPHKVLESTINERNSMRNDSNNIQINQIKIEPPMYNNSEILKAVLGSPIRPYPP